MARALDRIWVRFGLWIAATVLLTIGLLAASVYLFAETQYRNFERTLPEPVRQELADLVERDQEDSPRAIEIYGKYWKGELLFGEKLSLLVGLAVCLPVGLIAGFWVSRTVTLPLGSMATAAQRIALGDLSVRAEPSRERGEMTEMVHHFNDMADALEAFERERKATAAAISHELRTPLTIMRARLHAACDGVIEPSAQEFHQLLDQAEHLSRLVDDLHTLSMADAGRLSLHRSPLDLVTLAQDTLDRHGIRLAQFGFEAGVTARVASAVVDVDEDRIRQVLSNLVENALRHAQQGRWLELSVDVEASQVGTASEVLPAMAVLSVSDAGPGLSGPAQRDMFQRFSRSGAGAGTADPAERQGGGSGLGLSIVHMLVSRHGGQIGVDRSARGGTRFTIRLPLAAGSQAPEAGAA